MSDQITQAHQIALDMVDRLQNREQQLESELRAAREEIERLKQDNSQSWKASALKVTMELDAAIQQVAKLREERDRLERMRSDFIASLNELSDFSVNLVQQLTRERDAALAASENSSS